MYKPEQDKKSITLKNVTLDSIDKLDLDAITLDELDDFGIDSNDIPQMYKDTISMEFLTSGCRYASDNFTYNQDTISGLKKQPNLLSPHTKEPLTIKHLNSDVIDAKKIFLKILIYNKLLDKSLQSGSKKSTSESKEEKLYVEKNELEEKIKAVIELMKSSYSVLATNIEKGKGAKLGKAIMPLLMGTNGLAKYCIENDIKQQEIYTLMLSQIKQDNSISLEGLIFIDACRSAISAIHSDLAVSNSGKNQYAEIQKIMAAEKSILMAFIAAYCEGTGVKFDKIDISKREEIKQDIMDTLEDEYPEIKMAKEQASHNVTSSDKEQETLSVTSLNFDFYTSLHDGFNYMSSGFGGLFKNKEKKQPENAEKAKESSPVSYPKVQYNDKECTILNCTIMGLKNAGKTALVNQYIYDDYQHIIEADPEEKSLTVKGRPCKLRLWENNPHYANSRVACQLANAIIIAVDITDKWCLERIKQLLQTVNIYAKEDTVIAVVGMKADLNDQWKANEVMIKELIKEECDSGVLYYGVSAKTGENVTECFEAIAIELEKQLCGKEEAQSSAPSNSAIFSSYGNKNNQPRTSTKSTFSSILKFGK